MAVKFYWKQSQRKDWPLLQNERPDILPDQDDRALLLMSLVIDGEASESELNELNRLMDGLPRMADEFSQLKSISMLESSFPEIEPPAHLTSAILQSTIDRKSVFAQVFGSYQTPAFRYAVPAGAVAACGLAVLFLSTTHLPIKSGSHKADSILKNSKDYDVAANIPGRLLEKPNSAPSEAPAEKHSVKNVTASSIKKTNHRNANFDSHHWHGKQMLAKISHPAERIAAASNQPAASPEPAAPVYHPDPPVALAYSPRPMMDVNSQRSLMARSNATSIPWNDLKSTDESSVSPDKSAAGSPDKTTDTQPKVKVHYAHLILSQIPPDSRNIQTSADFKKLRDAANQGYDRETMAGIERGQATFKLVGRF